MREGDGVRWRVLIFKGPLLMTRKSEDEISGTERDAFDLPRQPFSNEIKITETGRDSTPVFHTIFVF